MINYVEAIYRIQKNYWRLNMTVFLSIIWFLIVISVIVIVHEFGHFLFAKLFKTKVEEFAIGFGPAIFKIAGKETLFRFNCIPLGGYVRLGGEEIFDEEDKKRRSFIVLQ